jgi:hypothetical protein
MIGLILLGSCIGLTLGLAQFRVKALLPALAAVWAVSWIAMAAGGLWQVLLAMTLAAIAVQAGFFFGMLARYVRTDVGFRAKPTAVSVSRR